VEKACYPVSVLCRVLKASRSGYYDWRRRRRDDPVREELIEQTRAIHRQSRGSYGSRRMAKALQRKGYPVGRHQARSLMREAGVECRQRRRFRCTTDSDHGQAVAPNRLQRQFELGEPNRAWVADITAIWTLQGWLYLAAVLDLHDRQLIGWALAGHRRTELVLSALDMALGRRRPPRGLIHHSDRGSQYAAADYRERLDQHGLLASMSRKGDCWDNSVMERFFGSLKSEWTDGQRYLTQEQARRDVIEYIEMHYNSERLHSTLGYITPREQELATAT
jgi:transposase InsO family protein